MQLHMGFGATRDHPRQVSSTIFGKPWRASWCILYSETYIILSKAPSIIKLPPISPPIMLPTVQYSPSGRGLDGVRSTGSGRGQLDGKLDGKLDGVRSTISRINGRPDPMVFA